MRAQEQLVGAAEAARQLGVSRQQIYRLISNGVLTEHANEIGRVGVSAREIKQLASSSRQAGRPLEPATAWIALRMLSGSTPVGVNPQKARRLKRMLSAIDVDTLVWRLRRRAQVTHLGVDQAALAALFNDDRLQPTGVNALNDAARRALGVDPGELDAYVTRSNLAVANQSSSALTPVAASTMRLRVVDSLAAIPVTIEQRTEPTVVALDLCDEPDVQRKCRGRQELASALQRFRAYTVNV